MQISNETSGFFEVPAPHLSDRLYLFYFVVLLRRHDPRDAGDCDRTTFRPRTPYQLHSTTSRLVMTMQEPGEIASNAFTAQNKPFSHA
jgi:hypothetical protein